MEEIKPNDIMYNACSNMCDMKVSDWLVPTQQTVSMSRILPMQVSNAAKKSPFCAAG